MKNKHPLNWQWWKWVLVVLYILFYLFLILLLGGDWYWVEGWIFGIGVISFLYTITIYLYIKDPALLKERMKMPGYGGQKGWDKFWLILFAILLMVWLVIMPLDARRFGWSPVFPLWVQILGGIFLILSFYVMMRSFADNTYLSAMVRHQKERGHKVVDTGVYTIVRHPFYSGAVLMLFGSPMLLESMVGIYFGIVLILDLVIRIFGEEKMLIEELDGYKAYKKKVKWRLVPFIW